jgi:hypothetical protein
MAALAPAALAQVRLDAARVLARVQTALSFQVATALQLALDALLARCLVCIQVTPHHAAPNCYQPPRAVQPALRF